MLGEWTSARKRCRTSHVDRRRITVEFKTLKSFVWCSRLGLIHGQWNNQKYLFAKTRHIEGKAALNGVSDVLVNPELKWKWRRLAQHGVALWCVINFAIKALQRPSKFICRAARFRKVLLNCTGNFSRTTGEVDGTALMSWRWRRC